LDIWKQSPVFVGFDYVAAFPRQVISQWIGIGCTDNPGSWHSCPYPSWEEDTDNGTLAHSRWQIDNEIIQFWLPFKHPFRYCLQFITDVFNVPVPDWRLWHNHLPHPFHKL